MSEVSLNDVYLEDCVTFMQKLSPGSVDLIIADPPYFSTNNDRKKYDRMSDLNIDDYLKWSDSWIEQCSRICSEKGSVYVFAGHIILELYPILKKYFQFRTQIAWITKNRLVTTPQLKNWFPKSQIVLYFSKSDKYIWNPIVKEYGIMESSNYQIIPNIMRNMKEGVAHPSQKPLALVDKFIKASSNPDSLVFDPFCGSGTTCVSAKKLGRNYISCELNQEYVNLAKQRIAAI